MSNNKNDEIGKIKYGELHYPIKIKTTMQYSELVQGIGNSSLIFKDKIKDEIMNKLGQLLAMMVNDFNNDF